MAFEIIPAGEEDEYNILEITDLAGLNVRDKALAGEPDEFTTLTNGLFIGRGIEKRLGTAKKGTAQTGDKVVGLGIHDQDSGATLLTVVNQTLYKFTGGAWAASDKTDYTADLDTDIEPFNSKSGAALVTGTSTSGSTTYLIEDTGKSWTLGQYAGFCVVIEGEIKYIADNTATTLILGEKLNSDTDSSYQSKSYAIHALSPHSIIANGTDSVQKYDLTDTTALDGTHVTSGKAIPTAKVMASHQGRIWYAKGTGDDNDRVFLSDIGVAENITVDTNLNINLQFFNDGDNIVNLDSLPLQQGSVCVVAKSRSVHVIEGENILNYSSRPVIERDGCIAQKSFAVGRGTAYMLGEKGVLSTTDQQSSSVLTDPLPISRPIQDDIDGLTAAQRANASGIVFDNKYFLRIGPRMWYYDIEASLRQNKHVWIDLNYMDIDFNAFTVMDQVLYGGSSVNGQVYELFSTNQDDGSNHSLVIDSREFSLPGRPHIWVDRIEIMAEKETSTVFGMQIATDGGSFGTVQSRTLSNTNGRYVFDVKKRCYSIRYKLTETGSNTAARIILPIRIFFAESDFGEDGTKG